MQTPLIIQALMRVCPGARWKLAGDTYDGLEWLDDTQPKPAPADLGL